MTAQRTNEALEDFPVLIEDDGLDLTIGIEIDCDDHDPAISDAAWDTLDDDEQDAAEENYTRGIWAGICAHAQTFLVGADDRQLVLPGLTAPAPLALFDFDDVYDGPGSIYAVVVLATPQDAAEDRATAEIIKALAGAVHAYQAVQDASEAAAAALVTAAEAKAQAKLDETRATIEAEENARTTLIRVDHSETLRRLEGHAYQGVWGILDREIYRRLHAAERAKGSVYGVTPAEYARLAELKGRKILKFTKLRTRDAAGWTPGISDSSVARAVAA